MADTGVLKKVGKALQECRRHASGFMKALAVAVYFPYLICRENLLFQHSSLDDLDAGCLLRHT